MNFTRAFTQYTKELSSPEYNPLTKERERELLIQLSSGSVEARECIIKAHLRFVVYLLRDFKIPTYTDPMELIQEGNLALMEAISRFDINQNCRVHTYAQYWIRWYISIALGIYDNKDTVERNLPEDFDLNAIADEFSEEDNFKVEEVVHKDILRNIKKVLDEREAKIISLRYGLEYPFKAKTLKDVGSMLHLNSERIRQIEEDAIQKLRNNNNIIGKGI